jgi:hypothetical protein
LATSRPRRCPAPIRSPRRRRWRPQRRLGALHGHSAQRVRQGGRRFGAGRNERAVVDRPFRRGFSELGLERLPRLLVQLRVLAQRG